MRVLAYLCLAACGRVGFDATDGAHSAQGDALLGSYPQAVLADHPVAYYRLNEPSGTVAFDASGNHRDAMYEVGDGGMLAYAMPGAIADDLAVGMIGDGNVSNPPGYASILMPPEAFAFAGDFTVEGWVKPSAPPSGFNDAFLIWEKYRVTGFRTGWDPSLHAMLWLDESGGSGAVEATGQLVAGEWTYLVFTDAGGTFALYVDGTLAAQDALVYAAPEPDGANSFGPDHGLPGGDAYDELALYDYALDASRIASHYAAAQ